MNYFLTKTLKLSRTTCYYISQVGYANQSHINIPLDNAYVKDVTDENK